MKNHKDDLKTVEVVWETNFLYMDMTILKRGITLEPLGRTSQIICHAHLLFICIVYSNFHVDDLKTVVKELDKKGNVKTICHLFSRCRRGTWTVGNTDF